MNAQVKRCHGARPRKDTRGWAHLVWVAFLAISANSLNAGDVVSREVSVRNDVNPPPIVTDAVSREVSVRNVTLAPPLIVDSVSREVSARNVFNCSGDITGDASTDMNDISRFVSVLIGVESHPYFQQACDVNCDGHADGLDVQPFVNLLLAP